MITYRQYKILKALKNLYEKKKLKEEEENKIITNQMYYSTSIAHINVCTSELKEFLKNKYSDDVLVCELHNLGEMGFIDIDSKNREEVLYYSILNKGRVEVSDYPIKCLKNWTLPVLVSIITSIIISLITTLISNNLSA